MSSLPRGTLTVSVDLEFSSSQPTLAEQRALDETVAGLLDIMTRHEVPAAWAMADPAVSAARGKVEAGQSGHELAILGDASWSGRAAPRGRFARELARRMGQAIAAGRPIRTLVLKTDLPIEHCDLAIKEGIIAVRQASANAAGRSSRQPRTLRFGLWEFAPLAHLPGESRWLPGGGGVRSACYEIDQAIQAEGLVHLAIDAPRLAARGAGALRVVERVLGHAARRRRHRLLDIATMGTIAASLARENQGRPSRSILRPAA